MKDDEFAALSSEYLNKLASIATVPHLITRYRCGAQAVLRKTNNAEPQTRACPNCLLQPHETKLQTTIQPQANSKVIHKHSKISRTRYQIKKANQRKRLHQQLIIKCSTCKYTMKKPLIKPKKEPKETKIIYIDVASKKKKKKKNKSAGLSVDAIENVQAETRTITMDLPTINLVSPKKAKKRKHEDVIVVEDSPKKKKSKKNQENIIEVKHDKRRSKKDLKVMKQQAQDIEDARKALNPLASKKEKKKLKNKLMKLKDTIRNVEIQENKAKSSLQNFLNSISV